MNLHSIVKKSQKGDTMFGMQMTQEEKCNVVNKLFAELSDILSEKYGCTVTMRAIPKTEKGTEDEKRKRETA